MDHLDKFGQCREIGLPPLNRFLVRRMIEETRASRYLKEFLGFKIKRGSRPLRLGDDKIRSGTRRGSLYAFPRAKSVRHFKDQIIRCTRRNVPLTTAELIAEINPIIRGWGLYYCKAHVRRLFKQLKGWIVRRIWSHRFKRWRNAGWRHLPERKLHGELGLVNLVRLIPTLSPR